jgi:hypothetical protein
VVLVVSYLFARSTKWANFAGTTRAPLGASSRLMVSLLWLSPTR